MSGYDKRDNSGSLFKNEDRQKETHANARGSAVIDGVHYFIDAWTKDSNGKKWQSLSFKRKDKQPDAPLPRAATASPKAPAEAFQDDTDSDIPW